MQFLPVNMNKGSLKIRLQNVDNVNKTCSIPHSIKGEEIIRHEFHFLSQKKIFKELKISMLLVCYFMQVFSEVISLLKVEDDNCEMVDCYSFRGSQSLVKVSGVIKCVKY